MVGSGIHDKRQLDRETLEACMASFEDDVLCECMRDAMFGHLSFLNFTPIMRTWVGPAFEDGETEEEASARIGAALEACMPEGQ